MNLKKSKTFNLLNLWLKATHKQNAYEMQTLLYSETYTSTTAAIKTVTAVIMKKCLHFLMKRVYKEHKTYCVM